jgi:RNA polymerase sigma-70 factor (ECF subfamily)
MDLDEEMRLVSRLLSGDVRALELFIQTYRRFITTILSRQPNLYSHDVDEVYQRFLLHIWEDGYRRLRPWRGSRSLRSYLGAIARNLARDYRRERHRNPDNASGYEMSVLPATEMRSDWGRVGALKAAIGKLSERDRDLIHRRYYLEESYREIADALGITVNHVGVALFRAESRLKLILKKHRVGL